MHVLSPSSHVISWQICKWPSAIFSPRGRTYLFIRSFSFPSLAEAAPTELSQKIGDPDEGSDT